MLLFAAALFSVFSVTSVPAQTSFADFAPAGDWRIRMNLGTSLWLTSQDGRVRIPLTDPNEHLLDLFVLDYLGADTVLPIERLLQIDRDLTIVYDGDSHVAHLQGADPANDHVTDAGFPLVAQPQRAGGVNFLAGVTESVSERPLLEACGQACLHTLDTQVLLRFTSNDTLFATVKKVVRFNLQEADPLTQLLVQTALFPLIGNLPTQLATLMRMPAHSSNERVYFNLEWRQRMLVVRR